MKILTLLSILLGWGSAVFYIAAVFLLFQGEMWAMVSSIVFAWGAGALGKAILRWG